MHEIATAHDVCLAMTGKRKILNARLFFQPEELAILAHPITPIRAGIILLKISLPVIAEKFIPSIKVILKYRTALLSRCSFDSRQYRSGHIFHTFKRTAAYSDRMREKRCEGNHHRIRRIQRSRRRRQTDFKSLPSKTRRKRA